MSLRGEFFPEAVSSFEQEIASGDFDTCTCARCKCMPLRGYSILLAMT